MDVKLSRLFMVISILIILICATLISIIDKSIDDYSHQAVLTMINTAYREARQIIEYESKILSAMAESTDFKDVADMDGALRALSDLERRWGKNPDKGSMLAIMDLEGNVYRSDGVKYSKIHSFDPDAFQKGWMAATVYDRERGINNVVLLAPVPSEFEFYLAHVESKESFASKLISGLYPQKGYISIFDELSNKSASFLNGSGDEDVDEGIVAGGLSTFSRLNRTQFVEPFDSGPGYRAYMLLNEPAGWLIGAYFSTPSLQTLSASIRKAASLFLVLLLMLIITIVLIGVRWRYDIRVRSRMENSLDNLTGLGNGLSMHLSVEKFLEDRSPEDYCLVCIDIANFNRFNIMFGFKAGDNLLRAVAGVLKSNCHCGVRLNSDVFVALSRKTEDMIDDLRKNLMNAVSDILGTEYRQMVSFKFGVCGVNRDPEMFRNSFDASLLAMKDAKTLHWPNDVVFCKDLQKRLSAQKNIEKNMFQALNNEEFLLYIQPKWSISSGICSGGEALVRWSSPELGFVVPDAFVPIFENNGFIVEVDFFMLSKVLQMIQGELDNGFTPYQISVNLSRVTLAFPNYIARLSNVIDRYHVPHRYIEFEITESALFGKDYKSIRSLLHSIKKMGFSISMDDFGSGYSSLNTLRELPVDVLKIDKEFLKETVTSERSKKIIKSIVDMSGQIGVKVVCEGVETEDQLEFLKSARCDYGQGYLFAAPMPYNEFESKFVHFPKEVKYTIS
ncbi:MAG: bifunctional diguanylate cyclase/phosphodiesterase [Synergistaceae bacterium]|jgi:EAL domain-containing protein (putative c-di-GMP-specific phosphodiesterase class I)/GGDEF domain-containing protein|nr:bifunctional diguanylate cyclase/phosphodiesterase [Synergistaceae bacterium]